MKKLYLFDFDGTLTNRETLFLFLKFYNPRRFIFQFVKHLPLFALLQFRLLDAEKVKKSFISGVLKGERRKKIAQKAQLFFEKYHAGLLRENAVDFIKNIDREKTDCCIVTASLDIWVQPFADFFKFPLIATRAEFKNDIFTGNFIGKNCNGPEKAVRIKEFVADKKFDKTIAFGDSRGDREMLEWADKAEYEFFH